VRHGLLASAIGFVLLLAGCGGGSSSSGTSSSPAPQPPTSQPTANPAPTIVSVAPGSIVAGSAAQTVTIAGTGFLSSSVVNLNGAPVQSMYVSATDLTAVVPAASLAADGVDTLTVVNPVPGGASPPQKLAITVPTPAVAALSPAAVPQGAPASVTVSGTGFEANSLAQWNGAPRPTTYRSSTSLQVALTAADVQAFGTGQVSVVNPGIAPVTPVALTILANKPTITALSPGAVAVYTGSNIPQQVVVTGSGFAANATAQANGSSVAIVNGSATTITVSIPASYFAAQGFVALTISNPGPPAVTSNSVGVAVTSAQTAAFTVAPNSAPAGSPDTTITLRGSGFYPDLAVAWNSLPLQTKYVDSTTVTATIPASLLAGFATASIGVATPENQAHPAPPQPFDTYLALPANDLAYNPKDGLIYAAVPGLAGPGLGNSIAAIDPATGVVTHSIFVGSEPNRIALSDDGQRLFVGLDGAGAVREVDLTNFTAGQQFSLGGGKGIYVPPYTAESLAVVPGQHDSVAVYSRAGVVTVYDAGVARSESSSGLSVYFDSNVGGLAFAGASTLYVTSNATSGYLYQLTVGGTGVTAAKQLATSTGGSTLQFDNGRLYLTSGKVYDAATGNLAGQFSTSDIGSSSPRIVSGPTVSDSSLDLAWVLTTSPSVNFAGVVLSFDEKTFNPVGSLALAGVGGSQPTPDTPADLIRWGQNGLAFHTQTQIYVLQGPVVKDISGSPADLAVSVKAPAGATPGTAASFTIQVQNTGPGPAQGIALSAALPANAIAGQTQTTAGTCTGTGTLYCDLGSLASGSSATVTVPLTPTVAGPLQLTASAASLTNDPALANNMASASVTAGGNPFNAAPIATELSPASVQAGSDTLTLTVNGGGFSTASAVEWNGQALPTTLVNGGQLTATVAKNLIAHLGSAQVSVRTAAPGGGQSPSLTLSIYGLVAAPANNILFDPFTRMLYATLPSTATGITGNSVVAIDPLTGAISTPVVVGSEPGPLTETSDGNYLFVGLSGANSLGRFNLLTQSLDGTFPLTVKSPFGGSGTAAAQSVTAVPGTDTTLAIGFGSAGYGISIVDLNGATAAPRTKSTGIYTGDYPVFSDPTHFYAFDAETSGAQFYRYSIDANGTKEIDATTLDGLAEFGAELALDGGLIYGPSGGIVDPTTPVPSQIAVLPLGLGLHQNSFVGRNAIPYAVEGKDFVVGVNAGNSFSNLLGRFDTTRFALEDQFTLPGGNLGSITGTRCGQDCIALVLPSSGASDQPATRILLLRGAFVLPAEANGSPAPTLSTPSGPIAQGSGNQYLTMTGNGFLPGATVLWNGSPRTTNYVDSSHLSVAVAAADVQATGTVQLTASDPGSTVSNQVALSVK